MRHPSRFQRNRRVEILGVRVPVADRPRSRLLGLALLEPDRAGPGLLIPRCRSIHTFGMRFAIDVAFLDREGRVIRRVGAVPANRLLAERRAHAVLELPSGPARARPAGAARDPGHST